MTIGRLHLSCQTAGLIGEKANSANDHAYFGTVILTTIGVGLTFQNTQYTSISPPYYCSSYRMVYSIRLDQSDQVVLTLTGSVSGSDLRAAYSDAAAHDEFRKAQLLIDLADAQIEATPAEMVELARLPNIFPAIAVLVGSPLGFGLARAFELACGESRVVRVFRDRTQARVGSGRMRAEVSSMLWSLPASVS